MSSSEAGVELIPGAPLSDRSEEPAASPEGHEPSHAAAEARAAGDAATPAPPERSLGMSLALLALAGFSVVLFLEQLAFAEPARDAYLGHNIVRAGLRLALVAGLLGAAALPVAAASVALLIGRRRAAARLDRLARLLAPLILLGLLPALFSTSFGHASPIVYLVYLAFFVLVAEPIWRLFFSAIAVVRDGVPTNPLALDALIRALSVKAWRRVAFGVVFLAGAGYAAYTGYYSILNHHRLATTAFDLGIYDNLSFNAIHGHPFTATVLFGPAGGNNLASHAEFGVLLFAPFYAIHPGAETLLIIQSVVFGMAAVPLYLFAATGLPRPTALLVAISYLFFAPLHGPNFYDFHFLPLAVFFHFWLYYAIATRRTWLTVVMIVILFAIREDVAVGLAILGLFLAVTGLRPRLGVILAIASTAWFGIDRFIIMPLAGTWYFQNFYVDLFADGASSFGSVFRTILSNPLYFLTTFVVEAKLVYVLHMFAPVAFLPFRRVAFVLLALPGVFFTIMTTGYQPTVSISFQYTTHWIPYVFLGTVLALIVISQRTNGAVLRRAALATLLIAMASHSYNYGAILEHSSFVGGFSHISFKMTKEEKERYQGLRELVAMIPRKASVAATEQETPHISARRVAYPLRTAPGPVDYLLIGRSHIGDLSRSALNSALANHDEYGLLAERGGELFLFKRGYKSPETAAARVKLGVP